MDSRQSSPNNNKSCPDICLLKCKSNPSQIKDPEQIPIYNQKQSKPSRRSNHKVREISKQNHQWSEVREQLKTMDPDTNPTIVHPNLDHTTNPNPKDQPNQIKITKTANKEKPIWFKKYGKHETTFNCYMCDSTYAQKNNLYRHIRKHHSTIEKAKNAKKTHICLKCKRRFLKLQYLEKHQCKALLPKFFVPRPRRHRRPSWWLFLIKVFFFSNWHK